MLRDILVRRLRLSTFAFAKPQAAILLWLLVLVVIAARVTIRPGKGSVYPTFARAAACWRNGTDVYLLTDLDRVSCNAFRYSPLAAAILVPFTCVPDGMGEILWRLLNAGVLLGGLTWWARAGLPRRLTRGEFAALLLLLLPLTVGNLNNGQSNPLVLGLLLLTVTAASRDRWNVAAACMAAACLLKLYPIAVGLLLAALYPRRFAGRLAVCLALGLALPFLCQRPEYVAAQYGDWFRYLRLDDRHDWGAEFGYRDLTLLFRVYAEPLRPGVYLAIQLLAAGAAALLCLAAQRAGWSRQRLLTGLLGLGCCWMTLFGSATESATYVLLAPSLAAAVVLGPVCSSAFRQYGVQPPEGGTTNNARALLIVSYGLFVVTQLAAWFPGGATRAQSLGPQPLAAMLLLAALLLDWRGIVVDAVSTQARRLATGAPPPGGGLG